MGRTTSTRAERRLYPEKAPEPSYLPWVATAFLVLLTALPYVLGEGLIELEVVVAQPLLRLLLLLLAALLAGLALRRAAYGLLVLPVLAGLFLLLEIWSTVGFSLADLPPPQEGYLRMYSQNIGQEPPQAFAAWLAENDIDLALLQEVYLPHQEQWEKLARDLGYQMSLQVLRRDAGMGGLFLSRYPLEPLPPVKAYSWGRKTRYFPRALMHYQGRIVELYTVHLESLPTVKNQRMLLGSSRLRRQQALLLARSVATSGEPLILAGDLNAAPLYRSSLPLRRLLDDAWMEAGLGLGFTYHAAVPLTRIDAVLHRGFRTEYTQVVKLSDSDHRGLYAVLRLEP